MGKKYKGGIKLTFYSLNYLENQGSIHNVIKYVLIFIMLIIFVFVLFKYLKARIETKYRDLSIILFLILLFTIGVQYSEYKQTQAQESGSTQMVSFIKNVAAQLKVNEKSVFVNSRTVTDETVILVDEEYYLVKFSHDRSSFRLEPTYLVNTDVTIVR